VAWWAATEAAPERFCFLWALFAAAGSQSADATSRFDGVKDFAIYFAADHAFADGCGHTRRFAAPAATAFDDAVVEIAERNSLGAVAAEAGASKAAHKTGTVAAAPKNSVFLFPVPCFLIPAWIPALAGLRGAAYPGRQPWPAPACAKTPA